MRLQIVKCKRPLNFLMHLEEKNLPFLILTLRRQNPMTWPGEIRPNESLIATPRVIWRVESSDSTLPWCDLAGFWLPKKSHTTWREKIPDEPWPIKVLNLACPLSLNCHEQPPWPKGQPNLALFSLCEAQAFDFPWPKVIYSPDQSDLVAQTWLYPACFPWPEQV